LTTKSLKREEGSLNKRIFDSFKTGITMTLTSLFAVLIALVIVGPLSSILSQIFTIMVIGLSFDILNTWLTNVSLIKWYALRKKK
jgi:preprotein translocase subunit SecF